MYCTSPTRHKTKTYNSTAYLGVDNRGGHIEDCAYHLRASTGGCEVQGSPPVSVADAVIPLAGNHHTTKTHTFNEHRT